MKIGITIDGVIRDFITKFESVYDKYFPVELEEGEEEIEELEEDTEDDDADDESATNEPDVY